MFCVLSPLGLVAKAVNSLFHSNKGVSGDLLTRKSNQESAFGINSIDTVGNMH